MITLRSQLKGGKEFSLSLSLCLGGGKGKVAPWRDRPYRQCCEFWGHREARKERLGPPLNTDL